MIPERRSIPRNVTSSGATGEIKIEFIILKLDLCDKNNLQIN